MEINKVTSNYKEYNLMRLFLFLSLLANVIFCNSGHSSKMLFGGSSSALSRRITLDETPTNSYIFSIRANETHGTSSMKIDPKYILNNKEIKGKTIPRITIL